jgi:hypothetical protein
VIQGGIVGTPSRLVITASMERASTGETAARASVEGPVDSLGVLVDRLAGQLLVGAEAHYEDALMPTSLAALRAYLDGQRSYRGGRYDDAVIQFERAIDADSTFGPAALGLMLASGWAQENTGYSSALVALAWAGRTRWSPRDRALLEAQVGSFPRTPSAAEMMAARERAVALVPDRPDAWYLLGDWYFHLGTVLGLDHPSRRAAAALRRALELDSTSVGPMLHLVELAAVEGDTTAVRRLVALATQRDSVGEIAEYLRWREALALHDTVALLALRTRLNSSGDLRLRWRIVNATQDDGLPPEDAVQAFRVLDEGVSTREGRNRLAGLRHSFALNGGRPREALELTRTWTGVAVSPHRYLWARVLDALFWGGDTAAASASAAELASVARVPKAPRGLALTQQDEDVCVLGVWHLTRGELSTIQPAVLRLRRPTREPGVESTPDVAGLCANVLETWSAILQHDPRGPALLASLDSLMRTGPPEWPAGHFGFENLLAARLYETMGIFREPSPQSVAASCTTLAGHSTSHPTCMRKAASPPCSVTVMAPFGPTGTTSLCVPIPSQR